MPEVVTNNRTGFIVNNVDEMIQIVKEIGSLNRIEIRTLSENKFNVSRIAKEYLSLFKSK
jgi:glycosyltransferase involved in cell wall biosynthesis